MTNSKYTPGPWLANGNQIEAVDRLHTIICTTACKANGVQYAARDIGEARASARLIAAAPELLEFVETMQNVVAILGCENDIVDNIRNQARVLVAKATGKVAA